MPRGKTLDEDREILTNLVQNSPGSFRTEGTRNTITNRNTRTVKNLNTLSSGTPGEMTLPSYNKEGSPGRSSVTVKSLAKSPYDDYINGMPTPSLQKEEDPMFSPIKKTIRASVPVSSPPDIGADLVASQSRTVSNKRPMMGGMLQAIRHKTNSLNALSKLRKTRKH
jgi:hypothetical protein